MTLNDKKSNGVKNIPVEFLKMTAKCLSSIISKLFNIGVQKEIFSSKLKVAKTTPLFKSDYTYKTSNYRPIFVLSLFSKILEKIFCNRLNNYFTTHNIISKQQFGFRSKNSADDVISDVINKLQNLRDKKQITCLILFDLSRAFDPVNRCIFISKLKKHGIRGNLLTLISNYLPERTSS